MGRVDGWWSGEVDGRCGRRRGRRGRREGGRLELQSLGMMRGKGKRHEGILAKYKEGGFWSAVRLKLKLSVARPVRHTYTAQLIAITCINQLWDVRHIKS